MMANGLAPHYIDAINTINQMSAALSAEVDRKHLLKTILSSAMQITKCDSGMLYVVHKKALDFMFFANNTLGIHPCHRYDSNHHTKTISLYIDENANHRHIAAHCYHDKSPINILNVYDNDEFDFTDLKLYDNAFGYRTASVLTLPLLTQENNVIGVLQLANAINDNKKIIPFDDTRILFAKILASQAAINLNNLQQYYCQRTLFNALLRLIANAVDAKSHHTSKHCTRVPIITNMIAKALNETNAGPLKDLHLSKSEVDELLLSSWLHDCGKLTTPEHLINKSTKLETVYDRIEAINNRFEILKRDAKIELLENKIDQFMLIEKLAKLQDAQAFLNDVNTNSEPLSDHEKDKIHKIAMIHYFDGHQKKPLLTENEVQNLTVTRGTLNPAERQVMENHVTISYEMLRSLPYPEHLKCVPEIAGAHHERVDGKGFPKGKRANELTVQARILAIADMFEALTAINRPHKPPMTLSEVLRIMKDLEKNGQIDKDLFNLFINRKIYLEFARQHLNPEQIDC